MGDVTLIKPLLVMGTTGAGVLVAGFLAVEAALALVDEGEAAEVVWHIISP